MKQKISKTELIDLVYNDLPGIQLKQVDIVVNSFLDKISMALSRGSSVEMRGFGSFEVLSYTKKSKNLNENISEKKTSYRIKFNSGKKLKEAIKYIELNEKNKYE